MTNTKVIIQESTQVSLPADLLAELAADAKETSALERPSVSTISLRVGVINYAGEPVKGNVLPVVIVAASHLNTYYDTAWDPDSVSPPACFAISEDGKDMRPHANVVNPQHATCEGCPQNEWGSAGGKSRGKACKETRRLVMLPAAALEDAETVSKAEMAMVKLPVTSVPAWSNYVNSLSATLGLPHYAVEGQMTTQPDAKTQFKVVLTPTRQIKDVEILRAVMARREQAKAIAMLPFDAATEDEAAPAANKF